MKAGEWLAVAALALLAWFLLGTKQAAPAPAASPPPPPSPDMCKVVVGAAGAAYAGANGAPPAIGGKASSALCELWNGIAPYVEDGLISIATSAPVSAVLSAENTLVSPITGALDSLTGGSNIPQGAGWRKPA